MGDGHWVERIGGSVELIDTWDASYGALIGRLLFSLLRIKLGGRMIVKIMLFWIKIVTFCEESAAGRNPTRFSSRIHMLVICCDLLLLLLRLENLIFKLIGFQIWWVIGRLGIVLIWCRIWNEILVELQLPVENARFSIAIFNFTLRENCTWKTKLRDWSLILNQRVLILRIFISSSIWMFYLLASLCIVVCNILLIWIILLDFFALYQKFEYVSMCCCLSERLPTSHLHIVLYKWIFIFGFAIHF